MEGIEIILLEGRLHVEEVEGAPMKNLVRVVVVVNSRVHPHWQQRSFPHPHRPYVFLWRKKTRNGEGWYVMVLYSETDEKDNI